MDAGDRSPWAVSVAPVAEDDDDPSAPVRWWRARGRRPAWTPGGGRLLVWALVAGTLALAAGFWSLVTVTLLPLQDLGAVRLPLPALLAAAALADLVVLRLPVRRELHVLGLQGAVLAVGLLTVPVPEVVLALAAGRALALALVRDAPPVHVVAGAARVVLAAVLGATAHLVVADGAGVPEPDALLGALSGVVVAGLVCLLLTVATAAADGEDQPRRLLVELTVATLLSALAAGGLGAGAVVLLDVAGAPPVLLLAAPAGLLVLLAVGWARGRQASGDLGVVRAAARTLSSAPGEDAAASLLRSATRALHAGRGELVLAADGPDSPAVSYLHVAGVADEVTGLAPDAVSLAALPALCAAPLLLPRLEPGDLSAVSHLDAELARWLLVRGYPDLVAVPVCVDGRPVGVLAVSGRRRTAPRLDAADLQLLSALAEQLGLLLATTRLARRLGSAESDRAQLAERVFTDDMTGLPRRPLFVDRVTQALSQRGAAGSVAVLYVDLDGFKAINDRLGHAAGDVVLSTVAVRLAGLLRSGDTAARLGGDEFAVLVVGLDGEDRATLVAARVLDALSLPIALEGETVTVRASVGIAVARGGDDAERLLREADEAMYAAKRSGGQGWLVAERAPSATLAPRVEQLVAGLSAERLPGSLELHYQPCVDLASSRVVAVEALVRWRHPDLGLLSPDDFVPLAERLGRMVPLGREVLRRALQQVAAWDAAGAPGLTVSVNLTGSELRDPGLPDAVRAALAEAGLSGDRLVLEVGEAAVSDGVDQLLPTMERLGAQGVRWALDGFGLGAVPLGRLDRLPLHSVKIPAGLLGDPAAADASGLSAGLVSLARNLGLQVVVEGVEREAQAVRVLGLSCDQAQGFHYGRPEPATAGAPVGRAPTA